MAASVLHTEAILDVSGDPLGADGTAVIKALDRMLTVGSYYSREHGQYLHAAEEACGIIIRAIAPRPCLALEIAANGLLIEGQTVDSRHRNVRPIHDLLVPLNIARLEIRSALTPADLRQALSALHDHRLQLGQSSGFREITIENLPPTVCIASRKVGPGSDDDSVDLEALLSGWQETPENGEPDRAANERGRLADEFRSLVTSLLESLKSASRPAEPSGRPSAATVAELEELGQRLRRCLEAELDASEMARLIDLARSALAMSREPAQAALAFRLLRRELGLEAPVVRSAPSAPPAREDSGFSLEQLEGALAELKKRDEPVLPLEPSARVDQLGICFQLLAAGSADPLPAPTLSALAEAWGAEGCGPDEVRALAACILHLAAAGSDERVDRLLPAVLAVGRRQRPDLLAPLWWEIVSRIRAADPTARLWPAVWPHLVNDLLLGLEPAPHLLTKPLFLYAGELDTERALELSSRLAPLSAVSSGPITGDLLRLPVDKVRSIHTVLMRSSAADCHGANLQRALTRRSPDALARLVANAVGAYAPEHRELYVALLREGGRDLQSAHLVALAGDALLRALDDTTRRQRAETWVVPAIEWLRNHAVEAAGPLLTRIVSERRFLFLRAWPPACRAAASVPRATTPATGEA